MMKEVLCQIMVLKVHKLIYKCLCNFCTAIFCTNQSLVAQKTRMRNSKQMSLETEKRK